MCYRKNKEVNKEVRKEVNIKEIKRNFDTKNLEFNCENLKNKNNIPSFIEDSIHFNMFKFKGFIEGFEMYSNYADCLDVCDIACFNSFNDFIMFIANTKIENIKVPISVYPELERKKLNEVEASKKEKELKEKLDRQKKLREKNVKCLDSVNVIPKDTKFLLIRKNNEIYFQEIKKLDKPEIIVCYGEIKGEEAELIVAWREIEGATSYKIVIKNFADNNVISERVKANELKMNVKVDPKLENEFSILKLTALNDNFKSQKTFDTIELQMPVDESNQKEDLKNFLDKYNVKLDKEIEEELLSLPALKKGKIHFKKNNLDFFKILFYV